MASALPSPGSPDAPKYWRYETGGELGPAVEAYINQRTLTTGQVALIRLYLKQWIDSPVWDAAPSHDQRSRDALRYLRLKAHAIASQRDITKWIRIALNEGHDPL